jgi:hypothetical protein
VLLRRLSILLAASLTICALQAAVSGPAPAFASIGGSRITCAGPTRPEMQLIARLAKNSALAREELYNRSRIGCIPVTASGTPQSNLLQRALRQQHIISSAVSSSDRARQTTAPTTPSWSPIGPAPIGAGSSADSGRVLAVTYDTALDGGTLFIGTAGGGIWSSTSPYTSWSTHTDSLPDLAVETITVDPSDATGQTIYAGTGEQSAAYDALYGNGVYKSTDGGATWAPVSGSPSGGWGRETISRIVISTTGVVYVGIGSGFSSGTVDISTDGGATWTAAAGVVGVNSVADLAIDSSNNVYAAVATALVTQTDSGVYSCASPCTASSTWTLIGGGSAGADGFPSSAAFANLKIATVPTTAGSGGTAVYAVAEDASTDAGILGVYRLLPGSATWTQIGTSSTAASYESQAWYDMYIYGDPTDATGNTVYFGLSDIYETTNATAATPSWTNLTNVYGAAGTGVHPDQHGALAGGGLIFFGNDGGMWDSSNGGSSFTDLNGNLETLQFYGGDVGTSVAEGCTSNCSPTSVIGGMQDNGTAQTTGASAWTADPGFGDGGYALIDPKNNNNRYGENSDGGLVVSTDGFAHSHGASTGVCGSPNFYAPMALDPGTPTTLLEGMRYLCETTDATSGTPTWTDISSGVNGSAVGAVAVSDAGGTKIYMSDDSGHTYFTTNNGTSWTSMDTGAAGGPLYAVNHASGSGPAPSWGFGLQISSLAADPTTSGVVYATVNGFQGSSANHVFEWTDTGGANGTWTDISGNLPDEPYDTVAINPANPNEIFVGGITGVFVDASVNLGTTWSQLGAGLPNVQVDQLVPSLDGTTLTAFTHGRSAWQYSLTTVEVAVNASGTYGSTPNISLASTDPGVTYNPSSQAGNVTGTVTCSTDATSASQVGGNPYTVSACSGLSDPGFIIQYDYGDSSYTVNPATLTFTAHDKSTTYGGAMPTAFNYSASGFVNGDRLKFMPALPTCSPAASSSGGNDTSPPGTYAIDCSGAVNSNYTFDYVPGALTVFKAHLTITSDSKDLTFGGSMPPLTYTPSGFVNGESASALASQPNCVSSVKSSGGFVTSGVSPYTVTCKGASDPDYAITNVAGTLTVNPATLTVTANNKSATFGGPMPTSFTYSIGGFVNGNTIGVLTATPTCSTTATSAGGLDTSPPGKYPITCSAATAHNYTFTYVAGVFTVYKAKS